MRDECVLVVMKEVDSALKCKDSYSSKTYDFTVLNAPLTILLMKMKNALHILVSWKIMAQVFEEASLVCTVTH